MVSGLAEQTQEYQVNTLIFALGDGPDEILCVLTITGGEKKEFTKVKEVFDAHFTGRQNIVYERAKCNRRCQEQGEKAEAFITAVHSLTEHCKYEMLKEELIETG